jgi:hypothetical protein
VVTAPGSVPGAAYLAALGPGLQAAGLLIAVVGVPVVFPDGRLPGPRWRLLAWSAIAAIIFVFLGNVLAPHTQQSRLANWHSPLGLPVRSGNVTDAFAAAAILLAVGTAAGAIAGLVTRWRRGGPLVRQQLLLLALATLAARAGISRHLDQRRPSDLDLWRDAPAAAGRDRGRDPPPRPL